MIPNLNGKQIISIIGAVLSVLMISTSQLTDLFGAGTAKTVVSVSGLVNLILQSIMTALTSQGQTFLDTKAMPGVENIQINAQANKALATLAVSPEDNKVSIKPGDAQAVAATAKVA